MSSSSTPKLKVTDIVGDRIYCTLEELKHFQGALKTLSKENYEKAKKQMLRNGFAAPFFVFKDANGLHILDGHQRHFTLLEMAGEGIELPAKFPCDLIKAKDVQHAKSLILAYNSQFGEMNDEGLYEFMFANQIDWSDVATETRLPDIDNKKFEAKFWDTEDTSEKDDEVPEVKEPFVKPGELWILGNHRLLCGDATSKEDVERLMNGEKADMVYTDPPYGIGYEYNQHDDTNADDNSKLVATALLAHECGKVWTPGKMNLERDLSRFGKAKIAIWYKKFAAAGSGLGGASTFEPILILDPKEKHLPNDVLVVPTERETLNGQSLRELHSCPKPVDLYVQLIQAFTTSGDRIAEPFCGSGTTLIACEKTNRKCFGMEIDPHYCSVIIERWQKFTGKTAVKE